MANTFAICGYSDDIVSQELDGKGHDETSQPKSFIFLAGTKSLHAKLSYNGKKGTGWKLTVELQDEEEKGDLPFDVRIVQERYSPKLVVKATTEPVSVVMGSKKLATLTPLVAAKEIPGPHPDRAAKGDDWDGDCA